MTNDDIINHLFDIYYDLIPDTGREWWDVRAEDLEGPPDDLYRLNAVLIWQDVSGRWDVWGTLEA